MMSFVRNPFFLGGCMALYHYSGIVFPDCAGSFYGEQCMKSCGMCKAGCHSYFGTCKDGCLPGWMGFMCTEGLSSV